MIESNYLFRLMRPESGPPDLLWSARQDSNLHSLTTRICNPMHNHSATCTWLGRKDSNLRYTESKSVALPLGYSPKLGGLARIRTEDQLIKSQLLYQLSYESLVEGDGFEPPRFLQNRFTVCRIQPLCQPSKTWCQRMDSNHRPFAYQANALTN